MPPSEPAFARAWLTQVLAGAATLPKMEDDALRHMTEDEGRRQAVALLGMVTPAMLAERAGQRSGLVEQQRLLQKSRRSR